MIIDASLCGMGRGAGNTTTELIAGYLNRKCGKAYDMDEILDAVDTYMEYFRERYTWGYSAPYLIAGMYCCHVNNISYLQTNHRTGAKEMRNVIRSLSEEDRRRYDYDLLEKKYLENQKKAVHDEDTIRILSTAVSGRRVLLIAPGASVVKEEDKIQEFIQKEEPVVIQVNAVLPAFPCDYLFLINETRDDYAKEAYPEQYRQAKRILLSNIRTVPEEDEYILSFDRVMKTGWEYFDNAVICCLRLLSLLSVREVAVAGFDAFKEKYNETYADKNLPTVNPKGNSKKLNQELKEMYEDFVRLHQDDIRIQMITESELAD